MQERVLRAIKPALFVYCFAPAEPKRRGAKEAHRYLHDLWLGCRRLEIKQKVFDDVGTKFPTEIGPSHGFQLLAAATRGQVDGGTDQEAEGKVATEAAINEKVEPEAKGIYAAFLFTNHDAVGLIAALAPNDPDHDLDAWKKLYEEWLGSVGRPRAVDGILNEAFVFTALCEEKPEDIPQRFAGALQGALPTDGVGSWWEAFYLTKQGFAVWEVPDEEPEADLRRIISIVAPESKEEELDYWIWTTGAPGLTPFARYLLHAAKLRFEFRVRMKMAPLSSIKNEVDTALKDLRSQTQEAESPAGQEAKPGGTEIGDEIGDVEVDAGALIKAQNKLDDVQDRAAGLIIGITQLREVQRTVAIATRNFGARVPERMTQRLGGPPTQGRGDSLFDRDRALCEWLSAQLENDIVYLEALRDRAQHMEEMIGGRLKRAAETQQSRLTLLQTSLLGAILMGLTVIQALQVDVRLDGYLQWPLIVGLAALALAVPLVITHWTGTLLSRGRYRVLGEAAISICGGATVWALVAMIWSGISGDPVPMVWSVISGFVGLVAAGSVAHARTKRLLARR